jgi:hypothetical protein
MISIKSDRFEDKQRWQNNHDPKLLLHLTARERQAREMAHKTFQPVSRFLARWHLPVQVHGFHVVLLEFE